MAALGEPEHFESCGRVSFSPDQDIKDVVACARALPQDSKVLLEAIAEKAGTPLLQASLAGRKVKGRRKIDR